MWVVLIARSTGSALRAVRPPNLHITPDVRRDFVDAASATGSLWRSPLAIMAHAILAILLASAMAATLVGRQASNAEPEPVLGAMDLGIADYSECSSCKQTAQIAIAGGIEATALAETKASQSRWQTVRSTGNSDQRTLGRCAGKALRCTCPWMGAQPRLSASMHASKGTVAKAETNPFMAPSGSHDGGDRIGVPAFLT